jgi:type II secretory pathway component PulM
VHLFGRMPLSNTAKVCSHHCRSLKSEQARCKQLQADVAAVQRQLQDAKAATAKGAPSAMSSMPFQLCLDAKP